MRAYPGFVTAALPASTPPHVRAALAEAKARLEAIYGDRLVRIVLYGSRARGDARPNSDVDLLVVLRGEYQAYAEIRRTGPLRLDLSIRYGVSLSIQPYNADEVADTSNPFMRGVADDAAVLTHSHPVEYIAFDREGSLVPRSH